MIKITVIIVTYNSSRFITDCIKSLNKYWPKELTKNLIIIDNNSEDNTLKVIKDNFTDVKLIQNKRNIGFAAAINIGIQIGKKSDYCLLINPDTIVSKYTIINIVNELEKSECGIGGGKTVSFEGNEQGDHFREPNIWVGIFDFTNLRKLYPHDYWHKYFYYKDKISTETSKIVDIVTGGFMLISKKTIDKIGYFDDKFFMYLEDVDYCIRAKNRGIKTLYCPKSVVRHFGGGSSNNLHRVNLDAWILSRIRYFWKHSNLLTNLIIQPVFFLDSIIIRGKSILSNNR